MILDGFICSGECKPPHFHSHPIRLLKPTPCIIHLRGHRFSLTWKSLDTRAGLLHRSLFERHHEMWQDIIQSCNMPRLSGVCAAVFLWIPQGERGREKRERRALVAERSSSSSGGTGCLDRWKANYWMGFLAVCWEEQRTDGIYRQQIKLLDWRRPFLHNEQ